MTVLFEVFIRLICFHFSPLGRLAWVDVVCVSVLEERNFVGVLCVLRGRPFWVAVLGWGLVAAKGRFVSCFCVGLG